MEDRYCGSCGERLRKSADERAGGMTQKIIDLSDVRYKLGMVYYRKGDLSSAIRAWRQVLEEKPEYTGLRELIEQTEAEREALRSSE